MIFRSVSVRALGLVVVLAGLYSCSSKNTMATNFVARMEVKEPIPGVCNNANVIAILPFPGNGQVKAKPNITEQQIKDKLNKDVQFLKDKPSYNDKGMVSVIVNCKGQMVRCEIDNKTRNPELDSQIVAVFSELTEWSAATIKGQHVDSVVLYSFEIVNGKIIL